MTPNGAGILGEQYFTRRLDRNNKTYEPRRKIAQIRTLISQRDEIDRQIAELLSDVSLSVPPTKQRKWHKANKKGKELQDDIEQFHRAKRSHPETVRIEELLVAGTPVSTILAQVEVSAPTVYIIKTRLKKEGRL